MDHREGSGNSIVVRYREFNSFVKLGGSRKNTNKLFAEGSVKAVQLNGEKKDK
jgi:hypothetical protein